jgi:hypothetical protein
MQPSSGSTGSITAGCCVRSGMSRRRSWKWRTIANSRSQPLRPDSNEMVSGEPGAIQSGTADRKPTVSAAQEAYELFVEIQRLDSGDLYAGKLCAALDRQHPRDLRIEDIDAPFLTRGLPSLMDTSSG